MFGWNAQGEKPPVKIDSQYLNVANQQIQNWVVLGILGNYLQPLETYERAQAFSAAY